jgi:hypothetical protein
VICLFAHSRLAINIFGVINFSRNPTIHQSRQLFQRHQHFRKSSPLAPSTLLPTPPGRGAIIDFTLAIFWSETIAITIFERISQASTKRGWCRAHWTSNPPKDKSFA